jgi:hypothetical protein
MSSIFSGPSEPDPIYVPPPPPVVDNSAAELLATQKAEAEAAAKTEADNLKKRKGVASTIKTGPGGILESANVARKELLG